MTTSCKRESNTVSLYLAMELSNGTWKLAFSPGRDRRPRLRNVSARDTCMAESVRSSVPRRGSVCPRTLRWSVATKPAATVWDSPFLAE